MMSSGNPGFTSPNRTRTYLELRAANSRSPRRARGSPFSLIFALVSSRLEPLGTRWLARRLIIVFCITQHDLGLEPARALFVATSVVPCSPQGSAALTPETPPLCRSLSLPKRPLTPRSTPDRRLPS
ncbi:hypothetical protein L226DRAFT_320440 [Lentinus tigrinus ALCF2SS1-7]|uniref:uncharacterized protein n=1 Tax=Lentinus tigrinus ALCF2SS1-7 TaxID=1328758 RepID=UPI001165F5C1|nr:hypothetical protein L226DRAFT_320440 [Lentinus tigrinus ALCF2SS1-7]